MATFHTEYKKLILEEIEVDSEIDKAKKLVIALMIKKKAVQTEAWNMLGRIASPGVQFSPSISAPAGKAKAKAKRIKCGINGCNYESNSNGISVHRKCCTGPVGPCPKCGTFYQKPSRQKDHIMKCKGATHYVSSPPLAPLSKPIMASASIPHPSSETIDRISPTAGLGEIEIVSSSKGPSIT